MKKYFRYLALLVLLISLVFAVKITFFSAAATKIASSDYQWPILPGFPKPHVPVDNPMSLSKVALGKQIFYDVALSFNQQQACSSCHLQQYAFAEPLISSVGSSGQPHRRNAQALVNIAYNKSLTWAHDGINSLEQQILLPMFGESPVELGITGHEEQVLARFQTPAYQQLFAQAFPRQVISFELIVKALASFVRSLISLGSPFDRYAYEGDDSALSTAALRGMDLFFSEKFECHHCHGGFNFTQSTSHQQQLIDRRPFHNTGLYYVTVGDYQGYPKSDTGLAEITEQARDNGRFRAPTLRNIAVTAPYMHDGSIAALGQVLDFYAGAGRHLKSGAQQGDGRKNPLKSAFVKGFEMSAQDKTDLLEFLHSLTDQEFLKSAQHAKP
jgi:cytochrome c peroxidase